MPLSVTTEIFCGDKFDWNFCLQRKATTRQPCKIDFHLTQEISEWAQYVLHRDKPYANLEILYIKNYKHSNCAQFYAMSNHVLD
jgi:sarcosine oxidase delta subunit